MMLRSQPCKHWPHGSVVWEGQCPQCFAEAMWVADERGRLAEDTSFKRRIDEAAAKLGESYLDELAQYAESLVLSQEKAREHDAAYEREQAERAEFEAWKAGRR